MAKTSFFKSCFGVFQGGGCRAAARLAGMDRQTLRDAVVRYNAKGLEGLHDRPKGYSPRRLTADEEAALAAVIIVGAYEEAVSSGVSFTEVAGTSAGSIVASLIGAGATPQDLREAITGIDFESFAHTPDRKAPRGLLGRVLGLKYPQYADLLFDQGFHSSSQIKEWTNKNLSRLLPQEKQPITFSSLPFPTYIVSTDLIRSEAKVWSQMTTPNELVSDAVEASARFLSSSNRSTVGTLTEEF